jgi:hypothetical protein
MDPPQPTNDSQKQLKNQLYIEMDETVQSFLPSHMCRDPRSSIITVGKTIFCGIVMSSMHLDTTIKYTSLLQDSSGRSQSGNKLDVVVLWFWCTHQQRERDSKCPKYIEIACAVFFQRERETERERECTGW